MIDGDGATGGDRSWGSKGGKQGDIITVESQAQLDRMQHDAPLYLGTLSSFANGCVERCNDPRTFHYRSAGTDVTVYIVDGVRSFLFTLFEQGGGDIVQVVDWLQDGATLRSCARVCDTFGTRVTSLVPVGSAFA